MTPDSKKSGSSDLDQMYGEIILDHQRDPRNFGCPPCCDHREEGFNPLCGDRVILSLDLDADAKTVKAVHFEGEGCSISMASASILTEEVAGKSVDEVMKMIGEFRGAMLGGELGQELSTALPGDAAALSGVRKFPVRIKCALLAWTTLKKAVEAVGAPGESGTSAGAGTASDSKGGSHG